jgi:hypothetical protein
MNKQEFVDVVRLVVRDRAASGTMGLLQRPPGRRPAEDLQI